MQKVLVSNEELRYLTELVRIEGEQVKKNGRLDQLVADVIRTMGAGLLARSHRAANWISVLGV